MREPWRPAPPLNVLCPLCERASRLDMLHRCRGGDMLIKVDEDGDIVALLLCPPIKIR